MSRYPAVDEFAREVGELRPLPAVALQVLEISESERFSAHDLAARVSADQALTARLLRLANSAYFGFPRRITTVRDAVVLLGYRAVRSTTLASCVIDAIPESTNLDYGQFWRFSVTVGMLAEIQARAVDRYVGEAFTAGVLHNIGRLALDSHRPDMLAAARQRACAAGTTVAEAEHAEFGFTDAELGAELVRQWNFPEDLAEAVELHQQYPEHVDDPRSLLALVGGARLFAHSHGITDGVDPPRERPVDDHWSEPPVSKILRNEGGIRGVQERVGAFMESAISRV